MTLNPIYGDCYFSNENGFEESKSVFVDTCGIVEKVKKSANLAIGELGFGTGLNLLATLCRLRENDVIAAEILYFSVEKHILPKTKIDEMIFEYLKNFPEIYAEFLMNYDELFCNIKNGFNCVVWRFGEIKVIFNMYFGDVNDFLNELDVKIDCWYLDGHSPDKNPEMWSGEICKKLYEKSEIGTTAATYTAAGAVKQNLRTAGFFVKRMKGFGIKRHKLFIEKRF
ncbi:MAG: tRNA (5-methylaminomethyl-2-thiouridine)(34)-methyltransferase MnmD [Chitinispirillales bacterium]|nr:tRNA (5-methylaminomethyl-2-thiouridine)(34)-methyltransferase MnmD [Chitinispirillales bacterium]